MAEGMGGGEQNVRNRCLGLLKPKFYALDMFPYPSGVGLHAGHPEATRRPTSSVA